MKKQVGRDQKLTKNQLLVLNSLKCAKQPLGAYALLDQLRDKGLKAPLQVYRTLNQLVEMRLVHRLESLNAWMVCCQKEHEGAPIFAICNDCKKVTEHLDKSLFDNIIALSVSAGFIPDHSVIEIYGQCSNCIKEQ